MLDIRDFGADSSGAQDSSSALQQAIDAITSGTDVGPIFVPTGTFKIATPIVVKNAGGASPNQNPIRIVGTIGSTLNMTSGFVKSYTGSNNATVQPYDGTQLRVAATVTVNTRGSQNPVTYLIMYTYASASSESFASDIVTVTMPPDSTFTVSGLLAPPSGYTKINIYASTVNLTDANGTRSNGLIATITASPWTKQLTGMPTLTVGGTLPPSLTIPTQSPPAVGFVPADVGSFVVGPGIPSPTGIQAYISATSVLLSALPIANLTVPITINTPKVLTQGNGTLSLEHLAFEDVGGNDASAPAPFILATKTSLHVTDCSFTGVNTNFGNNIATVTGVSTTAGSNQVSFSGSAPGQALGAAVFCTSPTSDLLPFDTAITNVTTVGGTTTLTLSQNANGTVTNATFTLYYNAQDAIVLGGTSEVQDDSPNGGFAGYNTVVDGCRFQFIRRAVLFRSAANACVIRANNIGLGCAGGFTWEPAIDIEGGQMGASSNVVDGNVVEIQWYKTGIRVLGWSNTLTGNYLGDSGSTPGTITYLLGKQAWYNTVIGGTCDNGPIDQTINVYPHNTVIVGDRKVLFPLSAPILNNTSIDGANLYVYSLQIPSGVTASSTNSGGATTYTYQVTAVNPQGETLSSAAITVKNGTLPASGQYNRITIPYVVGAASYNVYGRISGSVGLLANVQETGNGASWTDFGFPTTPGSAPTGAVVGGNVTLGGRLATGQSSAAAALASNGTIKTANVGVARVAPAANVTGIILQAGTVAGQEVWVVNESGFTIQFAVNTTSHVADGAASVIPANSGRKFVWDSGTSYWYRAA